MPSLRRAIDATCRSCIYDPFAEGTWREQVTACVSANCPLHPVRPRSEAKRSQEPRPRSGLEEQALRGVSDAAESQKWLNQRQTSMSLPKRCSSNSQHLLPAG
jgi:hypothetical protein